MNWSDMFYYDAETGIVTWKIKPARRVKIGDIVGRLRPDGYLQFSKLYKTYLLHRVIWDMCFPDDKLGPDDFIDHIDHIRTNNRLSNLRKASRKQNMQNQSLRRNNSSGVTGVYWSAKRSKWFADICIDYKTTYLGAFDTLEDAVASRKEAEIKHGFHKNHGK
ncbi:MAG: HNH endonuclease [Cetobacterium sp.]